MSNAKKCNRCGDLFEPKRGDLVILDLHEYVTPNIRKKGEDAKVEERALYSESENECDLCTNCSRGLRNFLKPIQHPEAA